MLGTSHFLLGHWSQLLPFTSSLTTSLSLEKIFPFLNLGCLSCSLGEIS